MKNLTSIDKFALQKRLHRFFEEPKASRSEVYELVQLLKQRLEVDIFAFGGLVRDINLFTVRGFSSDIDLVVDLSRKDLDQLMKELSPNYRISKNRYGGYRLEKLRWKFDVWCITETWAFKEQLVTYQNPKSILQTAFLNWDAVLYDLRRSKLIFGEGYLESLRNGELDVVLSETPNELGATVRILRAIQSKGVLKLGYGAHKFLVNCFNKFSIETILKYEQKSFKNRYLSYENVSELTKYLDTQGKLITSGFIQLKFSKQLKLWHDY